MKKKLKDGTYFSSCLLFISGKLKLVSNSVSFNINSKKPLWLSYKIFNIRKSQRGSFLIKRMVSMMMFLIILLVILTETTNAQVTSFWPFGTRFALNFKTEPPQIDTVPLYVASESTIANDTTGVLFYNSLNDIYDKAFNVMPSSAKHNISPAYFYYRAIFRKTSAEYYFFNSVQNDKNPQYPKGLYYSVIDMKLRGGLGDLDTNRMIIPFGPSKKFFDLDVVKRGIDSFWLITRCDDSLYAFPVNPSGIGLPVVTYTPEHRYINNNSGRVPELEFSNDGKCVVSRGCNLEGKDSATFYGCWLVMYDFDKSTGKFSNYRTILDCKTKQGENFQSDSGLYAICFSPNDTLFYVSVSGWDEVKKTRFNSGILQYNRFAGNIKKSEFFIPTIDSAFPEYFIYDLKLAQDGKIYVNPQEHFIGVILHPDRSCMKCGYKMRYIAYDSLYNFMRSKEQLSNGGYFPNELLEYTLLRFRYSYHCSPLVSFGKDNDKILKKFTWYFYDSLGKLLDTSIVETPVYNFKKEGNYFVKLKGATYSGYTIWYSDSVYVYTKKPIANFTLSATACSYYPVQITDFSLINADTNFRSYEWLFGDGKTDTAQNPTHIFTTAGTFKVQLIFYNGFCSDTATQYITITGAPKPGFSVNVLKGCEPLFLNIKSTVTVPVKYFYEGGNGQTDTTQNPTFTYSKAGDYKVKQTIISPSGCVGSDSVFITVNNTAQAHQMVNATVVKNKIAINWQGKTGKNYTLFRREGTQGINQVYAHLTDTFFVDSLVKVNQYSYTYTVMETDSCQTNSAESNKAKTILLTVSSKENEYAILNWTPYEDWAGGVSTYELERGGDVTSFKTLLYLNNTSYLDNNFLPDSINYTDQKQQCYHIIAREKDGNQSISSSNVVCLPFVPQVWIPNAFSPNNDSLNDVFITKCISIKSFQISIFNRWGEQVFTSSNIHEGWKGTFKNKPVEEGIYLYKINGYTENGDVIHYTGNVSLIR